MTERPIFVAGAPRTGSSMVAELLRLHGVWAGEAHPPKHSSANIVSVENRAVKGLLKEIRKSIQYENLSLPLPPRNPVGDVVGFAQKIRNAIGNTDGPWLVKTYWLIMFYRLWAEAFPDAIWILLDRPVWESVDSAMRHPSMRNYGRERLEKFYVQLKAREMHIPGETRSSITIRTPEMVRGDALAEYERLIQFLQGQGVDISVDKELFNGWVDPSLWHGAPPARGLDRHVKLGEGDPKKGVFRTICAIHTEMNEILEGLPQNERTIRLKHLLIEAYDCGIRMDRKLTEYAGKASAWKNQTYAKNQ